IKDAVDVDIPDYQIENRNTVRTAVKELRKLGYNVSDEAVERGFANVHHNTNFSGRWQTLSTNPLVIADCAHNEDGIKKAVHEIGRQKYKTLRIVFGACGDKDVAEILNLLPKNAVYYFAAATTKRAIPSDQMKEMAAEHGLSGKSCGSVQNALETAKKEADADDFILVFGSCYVVGEVV
ncbi:MAG: bifunctional folylpolyglutamate synthase/dihydrofolate synthase, partial [Paludibacteraceae bacterium]|nr:bifunctional folylpolyglutamate synthase/dihydrofolate synthase [Paludibacteraceae bacterium]